MKNRFTYRLFAVFLFLGCYLTGLLHAQTGRFYNTEQGLTSSLINQVYQDKYGFIWIATEYGLNRFDGVRFTTYLHTPSDSTSIQNNYVHCIFEDQEHNFYVGCIDGLMRYDRDTDCFNLIPMYRNGEKVYPHITQLRQLSNKEIWISTSGQGMFRMDKDGKAASSLDHLLGESNFNYQSCFIEDRDHNIWIGTTGNGVICHIMVRNLTKVFKINTDRDDVINSICEDCYGQIFIGLQKGGLAQFNEESNRFEKVNTYDVNLTSVYSLHSYGNNLLVGADGQGVKRYDHNTKRLVEYHNPMSPIDISAGKVHSLMTDREGNLWLGLFQKGLVLLPHSNDTFDYMGYKSIYNNPIGESCIMSLLEDSRQHLWVGTDNEGLFEVSPKGKQLNRYQPRKLNANTGTTVMCTFEDSEGNFWVGFYNDRPAILNRKTGVFTYPLDIVNDKIVSITEDKNKNVYLATLGSGFFQYNLLTKELNHYESSKDELNDWSRDELANDWINYLYCDREGIIWIGHYKGISCFDPIRKSFTNYNQTNLLMRENIGYAIYQDKKGIIWCGTSEGLFSFDKKDGSQQHFTRTQGLPNNVICGLSEDKKGNLWLSTYAGLSKYNPQTKQFINYHVGDGLQGNEFMHGAFCQGQSGRLYFGGINGVTSFLPENIGVVQKKSEIVITDFYVLGNPIKKGTLSGKEPIINTGVTDATTFRLSYKDNTFSIRFSTLQYQTPEQIQYQYKMKELGDKWANVERGSNQVTYNNLEPGHYTFSVRAANHGILSNEKTIEIIITPPWYQSWWAYTLYFLLFAALVAGIINVIRVRLKHKREMVERTHAEAINEAKLQFFINISHEIRTPMTLIINPLEKLIAQCTDPSLQKTYLMIFRNSQRILRLINQLMDIRKIDKGQMFIKCRETDLVGFIDDVMLTFEYMANKKQIHFSFEHKMAQQKIWIDLNNFDKVLMNILSNAFKYTPNEGEIKVILTVGSDEERNDALRNYAQITITDTGIGIDKEKIEQIFERFYQINNDVTNSNFGTGIGLHLSRSLVELHHGLIFAENRTDRQGSRFVIRIPLGADHLRADELEEGGQPLQLHHQPTATLPPEQMQIAPAVNDNEGENTKEPHVRAKSNIRILVVEDEQEIQDYLKSELKNDYKILTCNNGKEALDIIFKDRPDLVISDVMMPEMDGITLCKKIKLNSNLNHIPIILLTAKSKPEDRLEGIETGADAYMVKPFNTELLKSTIANLLNTRRMLKNKFTGAQEQTEKIEEISAKNGDEKLMERIMTVINKHMDNPELTVEMLVNEVGMSRVHLHRKLKELTNLSGRDFIKNIRMQQASKLFDSNPKLSISEVAYMVGYNSLSHFCNNFKEKFGCSPTEYLKQKE